MHNKLCPQYLCNCLPPTVSSISDYNFRNNENLRHDIFGLFLTFKSKLFHNETVDGMKDVKDILSLLLGVA
jgi:hypothetical protein